MDSIDMIVNLTHTHYLVCALCNSRTRIETRMMIFKLSCYLYQFTSKHIYICICTINFNKILVKNGWNAANNNNNNKTKTMNNFSARFIRFGIEVENNLKITCQTLNCMQTNKFSQNQNTQTSARAISHFHQNHGINVGIFFYSATAR